MSGLFTLLFLLALVGLVVGLVRPQVLGKLFKQNNSRKHLGLGFGLLTLLFLIAAAMTTPSTTTLQTSNAKAFISTPTTSAPKVTTKTITTTEPVPFTTTTEQDGSLAKGTAQTKVQGVNGVETQTFKVTYTGGQETSRTLLSSVITTPPINEVIEQGTYVAPAPTPTPVPPAATTPSGCYPLTNGGNCYEPGEYCRNSDHGASGRAGNGESIVCADNNGWRWEPR